MLVSELVPQVAQAASLAPTQGAGTTENNKFKTTCDAYRVQSLDAISALIDKHPFSAMTLACCAIDLLSHTLQDPPPDGREKAFTTTVSARMDGYGGEGIADAVYELRCGLVHEYRTAGDVAHVGISSQFNDVPRRGQSDVLIISVEHFCNAVCTAFEDFFRSQSDTQQRRFIDRAFIHVTEMPLAHMEPAAEPSDIGDSTGTMPVSGTGSQFQSPINPDEWSP